LLASYLVLITLICYTISLRMVEREELSTILSEADLYLKLRKLPIAEPQPGVNYEAYSVQYFPEEHPTEHGRLSLSHRVTALFSQVWYDLYIHEPDELAHVTAETIRDTHRFYTLDGTNSTTQVTALPCTLEHLRGETQRRYAHARQQTANPTHSPALVEAFGEEAEVYRTIYTLLTQVIEYPQSLTPLPTLPEPSENMPF